MGHDIFGKEYKKRKVKLNKERKLFKPDFILQSHAILCDVCVTLSPLLSTN